MHTLLQAAAASAQNAYAPYSLFKVGAAILTTKGAVVTGNNQEVASYSLSICAERVALAKLFSEDPTAVVTQIAVYSPSAPSGIVRPCGACLEYINECARRSAMDIEVVMADRTEKISTLLPLPFTL